MAPRAGGDNYLDVQISQQRPGADNYLDVTIAGQPARPGADNYLDVQISGPITRRHVLLNKNNRKAFVNTDNQSNTTLLGMCRQTWFTQYIL